MNIRAKVRVTEVTPHGTGQTVVLTPQHDTSIPEEQRFSQATPSGRLELQVENAFMVAALSLGQEFYIDITPVQQQDAVQV